MENDGSGESSNIRHESDKLGLANSAWVMSGVSTLGQPHYIHSSITLQRWYLHCIGSIGG